MNYWRTLKELRLRKFWSDSWGLPIQEYDLILSDFEPITSRACWIEGVTCITIGHQAAFLSPDVPRPSRRSAFGEWILKSFAPADEHIGFHFQPYGEKVFSPVIRPEIKHCTPTNNGHYLVYLPAIDSQRLIPFLQSFKEFNWKVYAANAKGIQQYGNVTVYPTDAEAFAADFASCAGVLMSAGFEGPSEALYLGKKLAVVPIKGQYEQACNAEALRLLSKDIPILTDLFKSRAVLSNWLESNPAMPKIPVEEKWKERLMEIIDQQCRDSSRESMKMRKEGDVQTETVR